MLSKSKGQVLWVDATLYNLDNLAGEIDNAATINLVEMFCQQTAFIAGKGDIKEEIDVIQASELMCMLGSRNIKVVVTHSTLLASLHCLSVVV